VLKKTETGSYGQILKSSAIIGGSSIVKILLGIVRTKFMAVLLGPSGVGLMGMYASITNTMNTLAGVGIDSSGVRQIAEAVGTGDKVTIARTATTLRRTTLALGTLGALLLLAVANPICRLTFGDTEHLGAVTILSISVLFEVVAAGQTALVQGMRRIQDVAKINILGTVLATAMGLPIIYFFREGGIVPLLLGLSTMAILISSWYARRIELEKLKMSWGELAGETRKLLKLGLVFMASGLMTTAVAYVTRVIIVRHLGIEAAGQYQAAWVLSGLYVGFILGAMGTDFYPRLTAVARDNVACNRLVNEQAEVAMLLAVPGILATILFAPAVIQVFYSGEFDPAISLLRWQMLGVLLKVSAWPIGFIILAKGAGKLFMLTETSSNLVSVVLTWLCVKRFGLVAAGVAFLGMYAFCWLIVFLVVRHSFCFFWSTSNRFLASLILPAVAAAFVVQLWLPPVWASMIAGCITLLVSILFLQRLLTLVDHSRLPVALRAMANRRI